MIKKLQIKFTALAIVSVLAVLVLMIGSINVINYKKVVSNADTVLLMLANNNGAFPEKEPAMQKRTPDREGNGVTPETKFESRFFTVTLSSSGRATDVNIKTIASVNRSEAVKFAKEASDHSSKNGFIDNYRYTKNTTSDGTQYIFLDCTRALGNFHTFLYNSLLVSALGFAVVAFVIFMISRIIIKPASESYEKQRRFITDAGHEIKTPLTIIDADASVAEMENGSSEWLDDIKIQTQRLTGLTSELVYLSRMEEPRKTAARMLEFPFSEVLTDTARSFESRAKIDSKTFSYNIEPMLTMRGDEDSIRKLTSILLDNAFKYSDDLGTVKLTAERRGKILRLSVYNTTPAISRDDLPHLFDRFFRTDKSRNSETGGYGIGLSIAQAIVIKHSGKIAASTEDEKSLTITATFQI